MQPEKQNPPARVGSGTASALVKAPADSTSARAREYIESGFVLVPIPKGTKGPRERGWNERENCWHLPDAVRADWSGNIGLAHAYSGTATIDVDSYQAALPALAAHGVELDALLTADDAVQIRSGRPDRAKLVYRLPEGLDPLPSVDRTDAGEGFEFRCGTKGGMTVQDVLPPSIHPDTGKPYEWAGNWRNLPELPPSVLSAWRALLGPQRSTAPSSAKTTVAEGRHADVIKLAARVARQVVRDGLADTAGMAMLESEQARGRWSRDVSEELTRAYQDALTKYRTGFWQIERPRSVPAAGDDWPPTVTDESAHPHTDHANAHRIVKNFGAGMVHVQGLGWHTWAEPWRADQMAVTREAAGLGRIVLDEARQLLDAAAQIADDEQRKQAVMAGEARAKWARTSEFKGTIASALEMAAPILHVRSEMVDADPLLLACTNGALDLRTGKLRPHKRTDFCTQTCAVAYNENARAPNWERFVLEVFQGDAELVEWVQRFLGYALTGLTTEHMLVVAHGNGSNGKTTLFECIRQMLGSYGKTAAPGLLVARRGERHPTEILDLRGARLVCSSETGEGGRLAEDLVKQLTGGDGLKGRAMRQDFIDFAPTFKLVLFTNHRPLITGQDNGIWRRIRLVPFMATFEGDRKDKNLPGKLKAEWPGIMRWCVEGLMRWQSEGFNHCHAIEAASNQYRDESDLLGQFIADECVQGPGFTEASGELYRIYSEWCKDNGVQPLAKRTLGLRMEERGYQQHRGTGGVRRWQGLKLGNAQDEASRWAA